MQAKTMTDQIGSFSLLAHSANEALRVSAIERFYQQWQDNELVLDKWFSIQATTESPTALADVKHLMQHPKFILTNPNKVRALIGAFCQANPRHFHAIDGSGYAFLGEVLFELDGINSQIAARLAIPFTRWQRLNKPRQELILKELERLSSMRLSRDLQELVSKSLRR
jgi:aminopeptidase N